MTVALDGVERAVRAGDTTGALAAIASARALVGAVISTAGDASAESERSTKARSQGGRANKANQEAHAEWHHLAAEVKARNPKLSTRAIAIAVSKRAKNKGTDETIRAVISPRGKRRVRN